MALSALSEHAVGRVVKALVEAMSEDGHTVEQSGVLGLADVLSQDNRALHAYFAEDEKIDWATLTERVRGVVAELAPADVTITTTARTLSIGPRTA